MSNWSPREASREYTRWELVKNWLYYYKWAIVAVVAGAWILCSILHSSLTYQPPDYQIAFIGEYVPPTDTVEELRAVFAELGQDLNGNGTVDVVVNCYPTATDDSVSPQVQAATSVTLTADFEAGDSYIFLMEDPAAFQQKFHLLAMADGSAPEDEEDVSIEGKVVPWKDCPALSGRDLSPETALILEDMYVGRRFFFGKQPENIEAWSALWDAATAR